MNNFKVYFYDTGIRNSILGDFREFEYRDDKGKLFENLVISEFYKRQKTFNLKENLYFWRTYTGLKMDLVLETIDKPIQAFEIKLKKQKIKRSLLAEFPSYQLFSVVDLWKLGIDTPVLT